MISENIFLSNNIENVSFKEKEHGSNRLQKL